MVAEAGLNPGQAKAILDSDDGMEAIKEAHKQARKLGIEGAPFFIFNGKIGLAGPVDRFVFAAVGEAVT